MDKLITRFRECYKDECDNGATHPLGRLALTLAFIGMIWGASFKNPDGGTPLYVLAALMSVASLALWVSVTMDRF